MHSEKRSKLTNLNSNYIGDDDCIYNTYTGNQTITTLKKAERELTVLISKLRKKRKPILVLTDIRNLGSIHLNARGYAVEMLKHIEFDKVAIYGNPSAIEKIVNFIITASGRGFKIKYFNNDIDAKKWLSR